MTIMKIIAGTLGLLITVTFMASLVGWLLDVPLVIISSTTEGCVKVESPNPKHSCKNLPDLYFSVYTR